MELVELLVKEGVELRHESSIGKDSLVELLEAVSVSCVSDYQALATDFPLPLFRLSTVVF
jgi:hypothetical protein